MPLRDGFFYVLGINAAEACMLEAQVGREWPEVLAPGHTTSGSIDRPDSDG